MVDPEDIPAFIEHCRTVYGRTLTEAEASASLNNLLDLYDLLYQPLPSHAPTGTPDLPREAPGISVSPRAASGPDPPSLFE